MTRAAATPRWQPGPFNVCPGTGPKDTCPAAPAPMRLRASRDPFRPSLCAFPYVDLGGWPPVHSRRGHGNVSHHGQCPANREWGEPRSTPPALQPPPGRITLYMDMPSCSSCQPVAQRLVRIIRCARCSSFTVRYHSLPHSWCSPRAWAAHRHPPPGSRGTLACTAHTGHTRGRTRHGRRSTGPR